MRWVYLSPHFDDAVLSCGGLIWEQVRAGQKVEIWTICAGAPPQGELLSPFSEQLHQRWQTGTAAVSARKQEDKTAVGRLGAESAHWHLPDCIYRRLPNGNWLVNGEEDLWGSVHPQEEPVVDELCKWLVANLCPGDQLVSPLTLGNHIDHHLVRTAAKRAADKKGFVLWYYADYPYAVSLNEDEDGKTGEAAGKTGEGWKKTCYSVSDEALNAWQEAVAAYTSQISTFWGGLDEMEAALETYWRSGGGTCLWKPRQAQNV